MQQIAAKCPSCLKHSPAAAALAQVASSGQSSYFLHSSAKAASSSTQPAITPSKSPASAEPMMSSIMPGILPASGQGHSSVPLLPQVKVGVQSPPPALPVILCRPSKVAFALGSLALSLPGALSLAPSFFFLSFALSFASSFALSLPGAMAASYISAAESIIVPAHDMQQIAAKCPSCLKHSP